MINICALIFSSPEIIREMERQPHILSVITEDEKILHLTEGHARRIPIFNVMLDLDTDYNTTEQIFVPFKAKVIHDFFFWDANNDFTSILEWSEIIDLFKFADYIDSDAFMTHYVRIILPTILNEWNTCYARYFLSLSQNREYIKKVEEHDDEWNYSDECIVLGEIDKKEVHNNDISITYIPLKQLTWIFPRLSFQAREVLYNALPRDHLYKESVRNMKEKYRLVLNKSNRHVNHYKWRSLLGMRMVDGLEMNRT